MEETEKQLALNFPRLENKIEKADWKQWLPVYGLIQAGIDVILKDKPLVGRVNRNITNVWTLYQAVSTVGLEIYLLTL